VVDSNCDPDKIDFPIPGNDDAARAISLYLDLISRSVIAGLQQERQADGEDLGAAEELPMEEVAAVEDAVAEAATETAAETVAEPEAAPEAAVEAAPEAAAEAVVAAAPEAPAP
jgi:small subunit ribosomal protein S2